MVLFLAGMAAVDAADSVGTRDDLTLRQALRLAEEHGPAFAALRIAAERDRLEKEREAAARKPRASVTASLSVDQPNAGVTFQPAYRQTSIQLSWPLPGDWRLQGTLTSGTWPLTDSASLNLRLSRQWPGTTDGTSSSAGGQQTLPGTGTGTATGVPAAGVGALANSPGGILGDAEYRAALAREEYNRAFMEVVTAWYRLRSAAAAWSLARDSLRVVEWEYRAAEERHRAGSGSLSELLSAQDNLRQASEAERRSYGDLLDAWQQLGSLLGVDFSDPQGAAPNWGDPALQTELSLRVIEWTDDYDWESLRLDLMLEIGVDEFPGTDVPVPQTLPAELPELLLSRSSAGLAARAAVYEARSSLDETTASQMVTASAAVDWNYQTAVERKPQSNWQVMLTFTHPLYEPSLAVNAELLRVRLKEAELQLERRREELVDQVVRVWREVQTAERVRAGAALAWERSRATLAVAQARQAAGLAAWNELGRAELAVFQARSDLAAAEGQYHLALLRLADALGLSLATVPSFAGKGGV